jgi:prevent-host-death family protein
MEAEKMIINATEFQNNFGKYLKLSEFEDIIITKSGTKVAKLTPYREGENKDNWTVNESAVDYNCAGGPRASYEEYLKIAAGSEKRYEYIDGEILLLASPLYPHQKAIKEIFGEFISWFRGKECEPLTAPFDVTLFKGEKERSINVVQPDILVICDREKIDENGKYQGIPALVVEVLSESTRSRDLIKKLDLYMQSGVKEYWVTNISSRELYIYVFNKYNIENMMAYKGGERAESTVFQGLGIELRQVFG